MAIMQKIRGNRVSTDTDKSGVVTPPHPTNEIRDLEKDQGRSIEDGPVHILSLRVIAMGVIVSMGGFIFGYDTGQISGFLEMPDFLYNFHDTTDPNTGAYAFSNVRAGTIVGLLSIGTLLGAILAAPVADFLGRKWSIIIMNVVFCVGVIIQIATTTAWYQIAIGRLIAGLGVGGLSVLTPMYQSETAPKQIRGALVSCYQLFITLGIFIAYCINFGTEAMPSRSSWRIPMGIGFVWPALMIVGTLFLRESPRWEYRRGKVESARTTLAKSYGVSENHITVAREVREIQHKLEEERAGDQRWTAAFTGPRMSYRIALGMTLQALQQLTGANYYFYYGTTIFQATGLNNSYVTSMILGGVNFGSTFLGLYVVEHFGRRPSLMFGGVWMFMCFMVFASVGHFALDQMNPMNTPQAGTSMIVFACLFIFVYAITWGPIIWAVVAELYPSKYRAICIGLATSSNWTFNFLISFFTPFITGVIDYRYGYVFAACNLAGALIVYLFLCESQGRSLEEIDTMYVAAVKPWKSKSWVAPEWADNAGNPAGALKGGKNKVGEGGIGGLEGVERKEDVDAGNHTGVIR